MAGHTRAVRGLAFTPDGALLLTASDDATACIFDAPQGGLVESLAGAPRRPAAAPLRAVSFFFGFGRGGARGRRRRRTARRPTRPPAAPLRSRDA